MFATVLWLKYAFILRQWSRGHFRNRLIRLRSTNTVNPRPLTSHINNVMTVLCMLYPQDGDDIVTTDTACMHEYWRVADGRTRGQWDSASNSIAVLCIGVAMRRNKRPCRPRRREIWMQVMAASPCRLQKSLVSHQTRLLAFSVVRTARRW